jgi:hypothetical protein
MVLPGMVNPRDDDLLPPLFFAKRQLISHFAKRQPFYVSFIYFIIDTPYRKKFLKYLPIGGDGGGVRRKT